MSRWKDWRRSLPSASSRRCRSLRGKITVLLVDQNLKWLMQVAEHHYVMDRGCIVFHGTSDALRQNPQLIEQYLGVAA